ncbi:centromere protein H [Pluvialis apricaria]
MELLQRESGVAAAAAEAEAAAEGEDWLAVQPEAKVDVLTLLRLRDRMKQQFMECSTAVHAGQESFLDHITKQTLTDSATQNLTEDMEKVMISFQNKTLALQRIQLLVPLKKKVEQNDNESRLISETLKHIVTLSRAILEHQQQARENEEKLNYMKRKRLSLKKAGRQKLLQINNIKKKQKEKEASMKVSEKLQKIHDNLQKEREMTTVIQHVFQNLVIASRVNWAEDPSLKAVVLQLEKNIHFL